MKNPVVIDARLAAMWAVPENYSTQALELAHPLKKPTTYDCHYLALAQIHRCDLWTGDEKFYNSVRKTFPQVKWIGNYPGNKSSHP